MSKKTQPLSVQPKVASASATIYDVAERAGVSLKTVSRVINKEPSVRDSTREKVLAAAAALGYQPSQSARSLAGRKSFLLGLVYSNPSASYVMRAQSGALEACRDRGFGLVILPCDYHQQNLASWLIAQIKEARLDGVVLTPPLTENQSLRQALTAADITVSCVAPDIVEGVPSVGCDDQKAAQDICQYLIDQGHRRIGHIVGHPDHSASHLRLQGYRQALSDNALEQNPEWISQGYFDFSSGHQCAQQLLSQTPRPTAIFASSDDMACAVLVVARKKGIEVPQQLSVVGFDDSPQAVQTWPRLTTVQQPVEQMISKATQLLVDQVRGNNTHTSDVSLGSCAEVLSCELQIRESVAPPEATP